MSSVRAAALLSALSFLVPAAAQAAPADGMGCPQGYATFDAQRGGGGPPSYLPGETVTASGFLTDAKAKASPSVTLRWGSPEGAAVGQAALDTEGSWKGMTFVIPEGTPHQTYKLYLEARDAEGHLLPGLPIPTQLRVGPPLTSGTVRDKAPRTTPRPETTVKPEATGGPKGTTQPQINAQPKAVAPSATTEVPQTVVPKPEQVAVPTARKPRARADHKIAKRPASKGADLRGGAAVTLPAAQAPKSVAPYPTSLPSHRSATSDHSFLALELIGVVGVLGLLAGLLRRRAARIRMRPRPTEPSPAPASTRDPLPEATDLLIEAELQEMIAEHRAREMAERREPTPSG